jgi:hypothetical protein
MTEADLALKRGKEAYSLLDQAITKVDDLQFQLDQNSKSQEIVDSAVEFYVTPVAPYNSDNEVEFSLSAKEHQNVLRDTLSDYLTEERIKLQQELSSASIALNKLTVEV